LNFALDYENFTVHFSSFDVFTFQVFLTVLIFHTFLTYEELLQETVRTLYLLNKVGRSVFVPHFIEKIPNALYWDKNFPQVTSASKSAQMSRG